MGACVPLPQLGASTSSSLRYIAGLMRRPSLSQLLWAFIAGCVLLSLAIFAMGFLAALPVPGWLQPIRQSNGWTGAVLYAVLRIHLPMAVLAGLYAWAVFRLLRARGLLVVLALSAPWLIYCFVEALSYYQESRLAPVHKLMLLFAWHKWTARLFVPLGVWVASKVSSDKAQDVV